MDQEQQPKRILVVEDELIVAADLEASLRDLGFEVVGTVGNAESAIAMACQEQPDIVLMDIQLHGEPAGLRAADTIRRNWNIPVVFLTAYTTEEVMHKARMAGAYGFLTKPFRTEDLNATLRIALQQHEAGKELFAERNWLVTMMASLSDGVIATDASGYVRYVNPAAERMTRWSSSDALGKPIEEVYPLKHMDGKDVPQCQLRRAIAARAPIPKKRFLMHVRGDHELPVEDAASPIIENDHLLGAVTIFLDITDRLAAEEQQRLEHGRLTKEVQRKSLELGETKAELRALSGRLITAQEDERRRVARELHDDLGQRAALMGWRVAELDKLSKLMPAKAQEQVELLRADLNHLSSGLREVSHQLHPSVIAHLGLATALREIVDQQRSYGIEITLIARDIPSSVPTDVATALFRIAQEAVRNAIQHAPEAPILLALSSSADELLLRVEDPGPGFDLETVRQAGGLGLLSIQERARLIGGVLAIRTAPDQGTLLSVRVPLVHLTKL